MRFWASIWERVWKTPMPLTVTGEGYREFSEPRFFEAETVAHVRQIRDPVDKAHALVAADDGSGTLSVYKFNENSVASDDGASVLAPLSGVGGRWLRVPLPGTSSDSVGFILTDYAGADATGALDSRNALQAALNAARAVNGTVIIPPGNFRIVATKPIYVGTASIVSYGGKLWVSLPDGYVNTNDYTTPGQTYTANNVLDLNGTLVSWTSLAGQHPWNGKTEVFTAATDCVIENLEIDFGWGTTGAPAGVLPITGVRNDGTVEFTYYQGFNNSNRVKFTDCVMTNCPGAFIEIGNDLQVDNCRFTEFGDHVFYFGGNTHRFQFTNNQIVVGRADVSTLGTTSFVFSSFREALKFRGNKNVTVTGNTLADSLRLTTFISLEATDSQPSDTDGVTIAGNEVYAKNFLQFVTSRSALATAYKVKNVVASGNAIDVSGYCMLTATASIDGLDFAGNQVKCSTLAALRGVHYVPDAIDNFTIQGNRITTTAQPIYLAGKFGKFAILDNDIIEEPAASFSLITPSFVSNLTVIAANEVCEIDDLIIQGNFYTDGFSWITDAGFPAWNAGTTYAFESKDTGSDGILETYNVVESGGTLWRNLAATTNEDPASTPAKWTAYTRFNTRVHIRWNTRISSFAGAATINAKYLFFRTPDAKFSISLNELGNTNGSNLANEPVTYDTGVHTTYLLNQTSGFGGNVRSITTDYTALLSDDFITVDTSAGNVTITLPAVATSKGKRFVVKKITADVNSVTLDPNGAETIDGISSLAFSILGSGATIESDGFTWRALNGFYSEFGYTTGATSSGGFRFAARGKIAAGADGRFQLLNEAGTGFTRLNFGPATASFPALQPSATTLLAILGDFSAYAPLSAANFQLGTGEVSVLTTGVALNSAVSVAWSSTSSAIATKDIGLARDSAGVLRVSNGSSGYGTSIDRYRRVGSGDPEGVVTADVGSIYHRTDGGAGTSLYVKESGSGNTGWMAK